MLTEFSNQLADAVSAAAPAVVQVQGGRRPGSGVVVADGIVVTTSRALGREDDLRVRRHDGETLAAELAGWDPSTSLAVLRVAALATPPIPAAAAQARVGHLAIALARSWSNGLTASAGLVSIIGGPLRTGRRRAIAEVIRTTAPMHDGFSGGAFLDTDGRLIGIATAARIRGLGVVIPGAIALGAVTMVLEHGRPRRGYLGVAGQPVTLPEAQRPAAAGRDSALVVVNVQRESPAEAAGMLVGDVLVDFDGHTVESPDDLLDLLVGSRVGASVPVRILRGGQAMTLTVVVGERPPR